MKREEIKKVTVGELSSQVGELHTVAALSLDNA